MSTNFDLGPADNLAHDIRQVAESARTEEDLRMGVEHALSTTLRELGLTITPEYEKTTLSGSADAVYGHAVIEYKRPGRLAEKGYPLEASQQIARYLTDQASPAGSGADQAEALEKMIGIGLDGEQILFLRYSAAGRKRESPLPPWHREPVEGLPGTQTSFLQTEDYAGDFQITGPVPVERESIELFLLYLRSLSRKPLTPEALAADFGPDGEVAPRLVNRLYQALQANRDHSRVATLYSEWERLFGIVYGEDLGKAKGDAPELAALYRSVPEAELKPLFFAVHTYYALLMKFLAAELASLQRGALVGSFVSALPAATEQQLRRSLTNLEDGGTFALLGINNFLEGDFFGWYLDVWDAPSSSQGEGRGGGLADDVRALARTLADFEPANSALEPESTRDLLKRLYQYLVPRKLRHDLGEYYTPDWLAERLLNQVGYKGEPDSRLIDPGCGSGTFLILALRRLRQYAADHLISPEEVLDAALSNVVGFDLNPLSVIAARTNYLLALSDLLRYRRGPVDLPVYMCDSILTPTERTDMFGKSYRLQTVVGDFEIPSETVGAGEMGALLALLESCVRDQYEPGEFLARARRELTVSEPMTETALEALYRQLYRLDEEGRNGLWSRLLKNAFAPVLVGEFDFVIGNPPWVNWESLSGEYREATKKLWDHYGLFTLKGHAARLGGGKKDLAMLFTYAAADHYLKPDGKLGFVVTQTVFKTKGAGAGFRRFRLGEEGEHLRPVVVDDMSELKPFPGVGNRTAVMVLQKGRRIDYPVPYTYWQGERWGRGRRRTIPEELTLDEVEEMTVRSNLWAKPVDSSDPTSQWITARKGALRALSSVIGASEYEATAGATTCGADGVFLIDVLQDLPGNRLLIHNLHDVGRREIEEVQWDIESDLVYPVLRGKDASRWLPRTQTFVLMTQDPETRSGLDDKWLKVNLPRTYSYLFHFRSTLLDRKSNVLPIPPFYSIYGVGPQTFSPHKVVWGRVANEVNACVISSELLPFSDEPKLVMPFEAIVVPLDDGEEAHYVCALLNSSPATLAIKSYIVMHPDTHILQNVNVPQLDPDNSIHTRLAALSQQAHELAEAGDEAGLAKVETQVDQAAAALWGITDEELADIRRSLEELG